MTADVSIRDVTSQREGGWLHHMAASQAFWVLIAVLIICVVMSMVSEAVIPICSRLLTAESSILRQLLNVRLALLNLPSIICRLPNLSRRSTRA